jgi:ATP-dependent Clp protease ATP-binding subunit ClpA
MAFVEARQKRHEFITVEHLLLCLLDNPDSVPILTACGANIDELRLTLTKFIDEHTPVVDAPDEIDTQPTLGFQRVIQRAILHVQSKGAKEVTGANCLLALFGETDSFAVTALEKQKVGRLDVIHYLEKGTQKKASRASREKQMFAGITLLDGGRTEGNKTRKGAKFQQPVKENLRLFISYSHVDTPCLDRLLVHLRPLERDHLIDCWSDRKIRSGDNWRNVLRANLVVSHAAVDG